MKYSTEVWLHFTDKGLRLSQILTTAKAPSFYRIGNTLGEGPKRHGQPIFPTGDRHLVGIAGQVDQVRSGFTFHCWLILTDVSRKSASSAWASSNAIASTRMTRPWLFTRRFRKTTYGILWIASRLNRESVAAEPARLTGCDSGSESSMSHDQLGGTPNI